MTAPTPALVTQRVDQWRAARDFMEKLWPHNWMLVGNDEQTDAAVRRALAEPYQTVNMSPGAVDRVTADPMARVSAEDLRWGVSYLLMGGAAIELRPGVDLRASIEYLAAMQPRGQFGECDRCELVGDRYGFLPIATPPNVVALSICESCAEELNRDYVGLVWV